MSIELPRLSEAFYRAVFERDHDLIFTHTVIEQTNLAPADAILALGYKDLREDAQVLPAVGERAAELYNKALAPAVIVSGGITATFFKGKTEAAVLKEILLSKGVPETAIIVEDKSTNTQENMVFSRKAAKGLSLKSLITVGHAIYGRRILMTLAKNWPEIENPMLSNAWYPGHNQKNWSDNPEYFALAIAQFERLDAYVAKGFIQEVNVDSINARISGMTKKHEPFRHAI